MDPDRRKRLIWALALLMFVVLPVGWTIVHFTFCTDGERCAAEP